MSLLVSQLTLVLIAKISRCHCSLISYDSSMGCCTCEACGRSRGQRGRLRRRRRGWRQRSTVWHLHTGRAKDITLTCVGSAHVAFVKPCRCAASSVYDLHGLCKIMSSADGIASRGSPVTYSTICKDKGICLTSGADTY